MWRVSHVSGADPDGGTEPLRLSAAEIRELSWVNGPTRVTEGHWGRRGAAFPSVSGRPRSAAGRGNRAFLVPGTSASMARPVAAAALTFIGGLFIILGGFLFALLGALIALFGYLSSVFLLGILVGFLALVVGALMAAVPAGHTAWGLLAIVLAVASLPLAFGGFLIGFLLTLIGGIMAIRWKRPVDRVITVEARRVPPPSS